MTSAPAAARSTPVNGARLPAYLRDLIAYGEKPTRTVVGLHSGTSADGPTAAVARVSGAADQTRLEVLAWANYDYESPLRERIFDLFSRDTATLDRVMQADIAIGEFFAEVAARIVATAGLRFEDVDLIASSGQVVYQVIDGQVPEHRWLGERAITSFLDLGAGAVIAERTGVTTVHNLRKRDIAAGGIGVPTVTYGDWVLFRHPSRGRVVLNIGGIANPTLIPAGAAVEDVFAFDSGPGNMIIDALVGWMTGGQRTYDEGGAIASGGRVHEGMVMELIDADPFVHTAPPRGAARQLYGHHYAERFRARGRALGLSDADIVATATALTAATIELAMREHVLPRARVDEMYVAGGGAHNRTMLRMLRERLLPLGIEVRTLDALGYPVDAREVLTMVALANDTVQGNPGNAPGATGARRRVLSGDITPSRPG